MAQRTAVGEVTVGASHPVPIDGISLPSAEDRFYLELEFVQNLSNPSYLHCLAGKGLLEDRCFLNFLRYLRYWKEPAYSVHLLFPQCLAVLDQLLDNPSFRKELMLPQFVEYIHQQQGLHWMTGAFDEELHDQHGTV
jgi:mediator of RNA polymerase II transcription subunit 31